MSELTEYGDIINAVVSVPLFARATAARHQGGAHRGRFRRAVRRIPDVRPDRAASVTAVVPAHDRATCTGPSCSALTGSAWATASRRACRSSIRALVELAMRLPLELQVRDGQEKWIMRAGVRRPAAGLHPAAAQEPDVALLRPARAGPAVPAAVRRGCTAHSATTCSTRYAGTSTPSWSGATTTWTGPSPTARPGWITPSSSAPGTSPARPAGTCSPGKVLRAGRLASTMSG